MLWLKYVFTILILKWFPRQEKKVLQHSWNTLRIILHYLTNFLCSWFKIKKILPPRLLNYRYQYNLTATPSFVILHVCVFVCFNSLLPFWRRKNDWQYAQFPFSSPNLKFHSMSQKTNYLFPLSSVENVEDFLSSYQHDLLSLHDCLCKLWTQPL